jgi:hypothetical protein
LTNRAGSDRFPTLAFWAGAHDVSPRGAFLVQGVFMAQLSTRSKVKAILIGIALLILMSLYSYFIPDTVRTRITDAAMTKVDGRFMIATEYRPFVNYDAKYRFKVSSGTIQNEAIRLKGREVLIRKYGWRIPLFSEYENVVSIKEVK